MIRHESVFRRILDYSSRADPYPLYARLRETPVARQDDGSYVVSTYQEITALFHDPRVSSDVRRRPQSGEGSIAQDWRVPSFLTLDPPRHDRLRRLAMRNFGPPHSPERVDRMRPELARIVRSLIDGVAERREIVDMVDDFCYPFPVTVICQLLGVPRDDEHRFHLWADAIVAAVDPSSDEQERQRVAAAASAMDRYMADLIEARRHEPGEDMLSGLASDDGPDGRMSEEDTVSTARLLLIAGHETTVNLITNGMLTLLRHPEILEQLRFEPDLAAPLVEELLRYEPPVHILPQRTALDDISIAGTTIPKGSPIILVLAAGSRDPSRFRDPDRFDPHRSENEHLGFGGGIHSCFGAPLARLEAQIALTELARRLENPRLLNDPPPYRQNPSLRGPRHLLLDIGGVSP
jgi:cytochrome P450